MRRSDEQLVDACLGGEAAAFDILVDRWQRKIRGAVYRVVRSEEEAQDICQEAFLKAFRGLNSFKREARFSSWLYQIAINLSRDRLRRRKTRNWVSLDDLDEASPAGSPRSPAEGGERWVEVLEVQERVASAVAALPEEQREAVILKEYQGLTFPEIAEIQGVPISTVKTRLYRGLNVLRERLVRQGHEGPLKQEKAYAVQRPW